MRIRMGWRTAAAVVGVAMIAGPAFGWGADGHRLVASVGMAALPPDMPGFLRTPSAQAFVTYLAPEADRQKGAGETRDKDYDPAHFVDTGDDLKVFGGPAMADLPVTRDAYDAALRAQGHNQYEAGYLPYAMAEGYQLLVKDFAYWRAAQAGVKFAKTKADKKRYATERDMREKILLHDLGYWSHYIGDASQPMHATVHFNGWGKYPNPEGFTEEHIHGPFESAYVHEFVTADAVKARLPAPVECQETALVCAGKFLNGTAAQVVPLYTLEKTGAFKAKTDAGVDFTARQIARGAGNFRDLVARAWQASASAKVGWPEITIADIESGKAPPPNNQ